MRAIRTIVDAALSALSGAFAAMYAPLGRPLGRSHRKSCCEPCYLQAFLYGARSERQLMQSGWSSICCSAGLSGSVSTIGSGTTSVFSKNRERLLEAEIAARFLTSILNQGEIRKLLSDEHFSVDGTLVEAWASLKSFKPKRGKDGDEPPASSGTQRRGSTSAARSGATRTHASRPPIRTLGSIARDQAWKPSSASSVTP